MEETYKLLEKINKERLRDSRFLKKTINYQASMVYANYWAWCRANIIDANNYKNFKTFIEQTMPDLNFWIKKKVLETYFYINFEFNYKEKKWNATRSIK